MFKCGQQSKVGTGRDPKPVGPLRSVAKRTRIPKLGMSGLGEACKTFGAGSPHRSWRFKLRTSSSCWRLRGHVRSSVALPFTSVTSSSLQQEAPTFGRPSLLSGDPQHLLIPKVKRSRIVRGYRVARGDVWPEACGSASSLPNSLGIVPRPRFDARSRRPSCIDSSGL